MAPPTRAPAAAAMTTLAEMSFTLPATHTPGTAVAPIGSASNRATHGLGHGRQAE